MTESPEAFAYSGEQWAAVVGTMPPDTAADVMTSVRQRLEEAAFNYRALCFHHRRRFPQGKPSPATVWKRRRGLIAKALADVTPTSAYVKHLRAAYRIADTQVVGYDMLGKGHKGTLNPARDMFHKRVLDVWTQQLQGTLTTGSTRRANKRQATSPAIRFFAAAVGPIAPIGFDAIKKIVSAARAAQREREKQQAIVQARARAG
jgi:hypothetical protein